VGLTDDQWRVIQSPLLYERKPIEEDEKALFVNQFGERIGGTIH